jgi:hypothetical protein
MNRARKADFFVFLPVVVGFQAGPLDICGQYFASVCRQAYKNPDHTLPLRPVFGNFARVQADLPGS